MKKLLVPGAVVALSAIFAGCGDEPASTVGPDPAPRAGLQAFRTGTDGVAADSRTYEITVYNLTPETGEGSSQVFSPPVFAAHRPSVGIFEVGRKASPELAGVAEDAANGPLVDLLNSVPQVGTVVEGGGLIFPGGMQVTELTTTDKFPALSAAWMLVNTNDAFSGLDRLRLPEFGEVTVYVDAYDAGSEENTESAAHIPGPCCGNGGVRVPTDEPITPHPGIQGGADLDPAVYGWEGPVAKIVIKRLNPLYEVTLYNLTPEGAQVFSPPVFATHDGSASVFRVGRLASPELAALAEDGMTAPLIGLLDGAGGVYTAIAASAPIMPGGMAAWEIETGRGFRLLSGAFMLVNTNDAFSGADSIELPAGGYAEYYLNTYDAGSEENTESMDHIPGPCCGNGGVRVPTEDPIAPHPGIQGGADLDPAVYGWDDPSAKLKVKRIR